MAKAAPEKKMHPRIMKRELGWDIPNHYGGQISFDILLEHAEEIYWEKRSKPIKRST